MQTQQAFRINAAQPDKLKQFLPKPLIISTPVAGWNGFYFAYHRQSNYKLPETSPFQHIVTIYSKEFQAKLKINGHWQSKSYAATDVGIFPAHQISPAVQFEQDLGFIHIGIEPTMITRVAYESVDADVVEIVQQLQTHDPLIQQIGLTLKQEIETNGFDSYLYLESAANMLAVHLLKRYSTHKSIIREYTGGLPKHKLKEAIAYINDNLDQNLSLAEIAAVVQMSPHYFASLFKQSTGIAPHQYVTKCRVERAKYLLTQELSVIQVSQLVGFQSQSHFAKVFRKYIGVTPQIFKKAL
ncbi:helix-turn-helix transcriptional regulator [Komarekiella sp. 'clone 1']|uniref:Helix-turn-helix transcriptional regulator n=1 Tax=Komarekiella delphini-convector SJRDD-AB1 TaxID=2593771 RepID=A0AA40T0W8_9NOST|nr:AraC family transcriptional regulator [Komarekiella delphini-convector]MBD6618665.1 helix-turn-helix transcriptional regulator [Komarekiella delphini-convector SJRDD-AB1]